MPAPTGYSRIQIRLHWIVAALIVLQYLLHEPIAAFWEARAAGGAGEFSLLIPLHVFGGLTVLVLVVWRLGLRAIRGVPPPPEAEPEALRRLARLAHIALYALMIGMPVSGAMAWFGSVEAAAQVHNIGKILLLALTGLHVVAALMHQFVLRTGLMERMVRPAG